MPPVPECKNDGVYEKGLVLIACTRAALLNGCLHFNKAGVLLTEDFEILKALKEDGEVTVDESKRIDVTTVEEQLEILGKKRRGG